MDHSEHAAQTTTAHTSSGESLLDILKRRYALGEITREQFEEMQRVLNVTPNAAPAAVATEHAHH